MGQNEKASGVDIDLGNSCSKNAYTIAKSTFKNREGKSGAACMSVDGLFSNMLDFNGVKIGISSDGIGTKIELAERTGIYNTLGFDLLAMVADDLAAGGFVPTNISNIIDVDYLDYDIIDQLMCGLKEASDFSAVSISGGEIAELGNRMNGYGNKMHFNWCSTAIGVLHEKLDVPLDGSKVVNGDAVLFIKSRGFRSNGFSLVRKVLSDEFGDMWHNEQFEGKSIGELLLTPSLIYSPFITELFSQNIALSGVVHVTGGGIADNFARILKKKRLGASIDTITDVHPIMEYIQKIGNVEDSYAYRYWNMGCGMIITMPESDVKKSYDIASQNGYEVIHAGTVTETAEIEIKPKSLSYNIDQI